MPVIDFIFFCLISIIPFSLYAIYLSNGFIYLIIAFLVSWLYMDFYSGILHIVFDNENINIPYLTSLDKLIKNIAHNFQYHHDKVSEIYTKPIYDLILEIKYLIILFFIIPFFIFGNSTVHENPVIPGNHI